MADLLERLKEALDETERIAQRAAGLNPAWSYDREAFTVASAEYSVAARKANGSPINDVDGEHIAHNDPAAVLRRVAADRKILARHQPVEQWGGTVGNVERWLVATHLLPLPWRWNGGWHVRQPRDAAEVALCRACRPRRGLRNRGAY